MVFLKVLVYEMKSTEYYLTKILLLGLSKELVLHAMTRHFSSLFLSTEQETDRGKTEMIYVVQSQCTLTHPNLLLFTVLQVEVVYL